MKKLSYILFFISVFGIAQTIQVGSTPQDELLITLGDVVVWENGKSKEKINFPPILSFPDNAYYLAPDGNGNFTKAMVETPIGLGEDYIVFDTDSLDVYHEDSPHTIDTKPTYLYLEGINGTELNPITLDFRKVYIDCFPNPNDILADHVVFNFENCDNITLKLGTVEGDKFKRALVTDAETTLENTILVRSSKGTENLIIDGGFAAGFMGDVQSSSVLGSANIDAFPLADAYSLQGDGRYESIFYDVSTATYNTFGLTGGLGYNRLLDYDMEDVTFKFYDINEVFISEITSAKYFARYTFPIGTAKMKVNVNPMDGRIENPTNFGHMLQYHPNVGTVVKNMYISDNHRGGIANIGASSTIEGNIFYSTQRYIDGEKFGNVGSPVSTTYHINCEDAVSRNLTINNNILRDKTHKILLVQNINADITNNTFTGTGNNISIYDLLYGTISGNSFGSGSLNGGQGTNKSQVIISNNTGSPDIELTNGAEFTNNNFTGADFFADTKGKMNNNTFTNSDYGYLEWTKEMHSNTFTGNNAVPYVEPNTYNYNNTFIDTGFRFQHGIITDVDVIDGATIDHTATPINDALYRSTNPVTIVVKNSTLKDSKIYHRTLSQPVDYAEGSWYFENDTIKDITDYVIKLAINSANTIPPKFYFKDCTFVGSGDFLNLTSGTLYTIVFDNCTIDANITMPGTYTNGTVTMPTLVEPRTQPIPQITYVTDHTEIATDFHIMTLQIRNKNTLEIVLDKDVTSTYLHYTANPNDFEYSIDGGVYWDSVTI